MANNKKTFIIEINGVTESSKSIDALYERLQNLQKIVTQLNKTNVSFNVDDLSKVVNQFKNLQKTIDDTDAEKPINSIKDLKKELKSLQSTIDTIDLGEEEYAKLTASVQESIEKLKDLQKTTSNSQSNSISKNLKKVTDETEKISENADDIQRKFERLQGLKLNQENLRQYGISLDDLRWKIQQLEKSISSMSIGSNKWKETNRELLNLRQTLAQVEQQMEAAVRAEDQLNTKIKLNINGMSLSFDDVNQAIGILEDKLYSLSTAGKTNTKEFANIQSEIVRLRKEVVRTDTEIDSLTNSFGGFDKVFGKFRGVTSLFAMGEGFTSLFGDNQQLTESIQKLTSIMVILESMKEISEEMAKQSSMGRFFTSILNGVDGIIKKIPVVNSLLNKMNNSISNASVKANEFEKAQDVFNNFGNNLNNVITRIKEIGGKELDNLIQKFGKFVTTTLANPLGNFDERANSIKAYTDELNNLYKNNKITFEQYEELNNILNSFTNSLNESVDALAKAEGNLNKAEKSANRFKIAINGVKTALQTLGRAVLIGLLVEAISFIIDGITKLVSKLGDWILGNDKLVNSLDMVNASIEATSRTLEKYNAITDEMQSKNIISDTEALALKMNDLEQATISATKSLQELIQARKTFKSLEEGSAEDGNKYSWFGSASDVAEIEDATKRLGEFEKTYMKLLKAVQEGTDENGEKDKWWKLFFSMSEADARADLGEMQKIVVNDIQNMFANIDLTKTGDALREELKTVFDKMDTEMYSTAFANIENLFPEQEWAKVLKARVDQVRDMYEQLGDLDNQYGQEQIALAKRIRDNYTAAIKDDNKRAKQELEDSYNDEIKAAAGNQDEIASIEAKYNRLRLDQQKQFNDEAKSKTAELNNVLRQIRDNNLAAEEESLQKRLQIIENSRQDEIQSAKDAGIKVNELILSINLKYDKLIEKEKEDHLKFLNDLSKEYARKEIELQNSIAKARLDNEGTQIDDKYQSDVLSSEDSYDFSAKYEKEIEEEKKYQEERLKLEIDYLNEKKRLEIESAKLQSEEDIYSEDTRYEDRLEELKSFYEDGQLSIDEYNNYVERETKLHSNTIQMIETDLNNKLTNIDTQYQNKSKETTSRYLTDLTNLYSNYTKQVSELIQKANSDENKNIFGIIDYNKTKSQLDSALNTVTQGTSAIDNEISNLTNKLNNNEISFVDYKDARKQLENTKEELNGQGKEIKENLDDLLGNVVSGWKQLFDQFVGYLSSFLSTINDTQTTLIDNQIKEVEHQLELAEEAYEKAEEAAEAHKDKMNEIEDELSEARGSRRQFLIDTLATQQAAYLEDVAAQQQAENEKTKLEEKQQALERKRQEQDKKQKTQQALINTYAAVSNALAVQPWFLGVALSAVALALGMKNVAAIQQTPIYENGGLLSGKSHKEGGIPAVNNGVQVAEVEGGEFITNRKTTKMNLPLLNYINNQKKTLNEEDLYEFFNSKTPRTKINNKMTRFANGGQLPTTTFDSSRRIEVIDRNADNAQYVVSVVDIINASNNLKKVQTLAGLPNE